MDIDFDHEWKSRLLANEQQLIFGNQGLITLSIIEKLCSQFSEKMDESYETLTTGLSAKGTGRKDKSEERS